MMKSHIKIATVVFTASVLWACGGGSGSGDLLRSDIGERGEGNPFSDLEFTRSPMGGCTTGTEFGQSIHCGDKQAGYFRGPPPRLDIKNPDKNMGLLKTSNPGPELFGSSPEEYFYTDESIAPGTNKLYFSSIASQPLHDNMLVQLYSSSAPNEIVRLEVQDIAEEGATCAVEGPINELWCFVKAQPSRADSNAPQILFSEGRFGARVTSMSDITISYSVRTAANITDNVQRNFTVNEETVVNLMTRDSIPALMDETGFATFFIYLPRHDITVFQHKLFRHFPYQKALIETNNVEHLGVGPSNSLRSLQSENPEKAVKQYIDAINRVGDIQIQIYHGDLSSSMILENRIPEQSRASRWTPARTARVIPYIRPAPTGGSSGGTEGSSSGADVDALAGSQTTFRHTCSTPGSTQMEIPVSTGPCRTAQENYARVFACNDLNNFASACRNLYQCATNNSSGYYVTYYQSFLSGC